MGVMFLALLIWNNIKVRNAMSFLIFLWFKTCFWVSKMHIMVWVFIIGFAGINRIFMTRLEVEDAHARVLFTDTELLIDIINMHMQVTWSSDWCVLYYLIVTSSNLTKRINGNALSQSRTFTLKHVTTKLLCFIHLLCVVHIYS